MKDDTDDILTLAFAKMRRPHPPSEFQQALSNLPRAPLATLIDGMIAEHPHYHLRPVLEGIAGLNQGIPEDMDRPDFQSYLIGTLGIAESELRQCMRAMRTYLIVQQADTGSQLLAAARDETGESVRGADIGEIRALLKKRK